MKKAWLRLLPIWLAVFLVFPVMAAEVQQIGWEDLVKKISFEDPFEALTQDQIYHLSLIARVRGLQTQGREVSIGMRDEAQASAGTLHKQGIDVDRLLARRAEIAAKRHQRAHAVVPELDGKRIRMAGYALPLEFSGQKITEFLLVPWVGACIHTPPPPPNQIVYVKLKDGIEQKGRFVPMWVTGKMTVRSFQKNLFLIDGSADIDVGYSLTANAVKPYE